MFALGSIDPLLVETFSGFDRPNTGQLVTLLSDGSASIDTVLQQGARAARQASLTGTITEQADLDALLGYYDSRETVLFIDGRGAGVNVRVFELAHEDFTHWWTFAVTLVESDDLVGS